MLGLAIALLVGGILSIIFCTLLIKELEFFGLGVAIVAVFLLVASIGIFQEAFNSSEDERLLKVLVSEKKVELKLNDNTHKFEYVLVDSSYAKIFNELNKNVREGK